MSRVSADPLVELRVDGGAARNDLLLQIQSDLLGIPLVRPVCGESTALGAAFLAGLAVEFWPDTHALEHLWRVEKRFFPAVDRGKISNLVSQWELALKSAMVFRPAVKT
jgi:glycerol kinase